VTNQQHPITPPPELVQQWLRERDGLEHFATQAARWGWEQRGATNETELQQARDEELEACCEWLGKYRTKLLATDLLYVRRPKPPSLKEQALDAWDRLRNEAWCEEIDYDLDFIRRALETIPDEQNQRDISFGQSLSK
jgi:hypothetical protein